MILVTLRNMSKTKINFNSDFRESPSRDKTERDYNYPVQSVDTPDASIMLYRYIIFCQRKLTVRPQVVLTDVFVMQNSTIPFKT